MLRLQFIHYKKYFCPGHLKQTTATLVALNSIKYIKSSYFAHLSKKKERERKVLKSLIQYFTRGESTVKEEGSKFEYIPNWLTIKLIMQGNADTV